MSWTNQAGFLPPNDDGQFVADLEALHNQNLGFMNLTRTGQGFSTSFTSPNNWTTTGCRNGGETFSWPTGISYLMSGFLAVADYGARRVVLFDSVGQGRVTIAEGLIAPFCLAATSDECLIVTDQKNLCAAKFSCTGQLLMTGGHGAFEEPSGIASLPCGGLVCTDTKKHSTLVYNAQGDLVKEFGCRGTGFVQFDWPGYVTTDSRRRIVVSDNNNHAVKLFDTNGKYLCRLGGNSRHGKILYPRGVCVDAYDNIYVAEWGQDRVSMYSPDARFIKYQASYNDKRLQNPHAVTINPTSSNIAITFRAPEPGVAVYKL